MKDHRPIIILAIESSDIQGSVALLRDGHPPQITQLPPGMTHGSDLVPAVKGVLLRESITADQIDLIGVDVGPGSYTGLRVGVTAARTMAFFTRAALVGVSSLDVLIQNLSPRGRRWASPVVVARHREIYAAAFEAVDNVWVRRHDDVMLPPDRLAEVLPPGATLFGNALARHGEAFGNFALDLEADPHGDPLTLARLARRRMEAGQTDDPMKLEVAYLHPSAAEWLRRH